MLTAVTPEAAMRLIESKGKANTAAIYRRHGVKGPTVGLSFADVGSLARRAGVDHALATALWDTGLHDARVLATKVADATRFTGSGLRTWLRACDNYILADAVAGTAARVPGILPDAIDWTTSPHEWTSAAGWNVIAILAMDGALDDDAAAGLVTRIGAEIHDAPNRTRYAMNSALIAIGGAMPALRDRALKTAGAIGAVEVDHGQTGCKTPDACDMIGRMAAHRSRKRTRVTAARVTPAASRPKYARTHR